MELWKTFFVRGGEGYTCIFGMTFTSVRKNIYKPTNGKISLKKIWLYGAFFVSSVFNKRVIVWNN